jgi:hypothetical protein
MFEKTPYEFPDPKLLTPLVISGYKAVEKTFGPVYAPNFIKYALQFIKQKIGEEPPKDIKTLDQLTDYLVSVSGKYPFPYCAADFAQFNVENLFEGKIGASSMEMGWSFAKDVKKGSLKDRNIDIDSLLLRYRQETVSTKMAHHEMGYKKNEDDSVDVIYPNCFLKEACKPAFEAGLAKKHGGKIQCGITQYTCQWLGMVTGYNWDFELLEYFEPYCVVRCYIL